MTQTLQYVDSYILQDQEGNKIKHSFFKGNKIGFTIPDAGETNKGAVSLQDIDNRIETKIPVTFTEYDGEVISGD